MLFSAYKKTHTSNHGVIEVGRLANTLQRTRSITINMFTAIKEIMIFVFLAIVLPWLSLRVLPGPDMDLIDNLYKHIGPTTPFLIAFSCYAIAGLWLVMFQATNSCDASSILKHTEKISEWIIPIGMIGTYYALSEVLGHQSINFSSHMHAMYSTLIALTIYVAVGIVSEFIKKAKHYPSQDAKADNDTHNPRSENHLIVRQIETTGCVIGVSAFIYYLISSTISAPV